MVATCEQEAMEVEEYPGKSPKINDLNVVINGKNNKYITINIFRVLFYKRTVKFQFFSLFKRVCQRVTLRVIFQPLPSSLSSLLLLFRCQLFIPMVYVMLQESLGFVGQV